MASSQDYTWMDGQYTFVVHRVCVGCLADTMHHQRVYRGQQYSCIASLCRHFGFSKRAGSKIHESLRGTF
jgi:hypothetical protein